MSGVATNTVPDQVAQTVTFRTASRIHWGRIYLPGPYSSGLGSTGRISSTTVDLIVGAVRTMANSASSAGFELVVPSTSHRAVLGIREMSMDSTADVIRSRRAKRPDYRKTYTS